MTDDGSISRKELARQLRRQAYQRAKALRQASPKYIAMKEAAKQRRKEEYQRAKARKKSADAAEKSKQEGMQEERRQDRRRAADAELFKLLGTSAGRSKEAEDRPRPGDSGIGGPFTLTGSKLAN